MIDDNTQKVINDILQEMRTIWKKSHLYVTRDEFEKLKKIRDNFHDKKFAENQWARNGLPLDDKFIEDTIPMTQDLIAYLNNADRNNYHFSLSAQDIIDKQISPRVAACSGHAKLFAYLAAKHGLDCRIIMTADLQEYAANKDKYLISGHQIVGVRGTNGELVAFDPQYYPFRQLADRTEIKVGNWVQSVEHENKYKITAILTPDEFSKVNSYSATENLYLYGSGTAGKFRKAINNIHESRADVHKLVEQMVQTGYQNE